MRVRANTEALIAGYRGAGRNISRARQGLLRSLAVQTQKGAEERSRGGAAPGSYPIPVRTGNFLRGFGFELLDDKAVVFNTAKRKGAYYARAIHAGHQPYGNPHAMAIPPRPFFDDALDNLDFDAAEAAWLRGIES